MPQLRTTAALDREAVRDAANWYANFNFETAHERRLISSAGSPTSGPGKVTLTEGSYRAAEDEAATPWFGYLELHLDGPSFAATAIADRTQHEPNQAEVGHTTLAEDVILMVDACLSWTTRQSGAWGSARVIIGLVDADADADGVPRQPLSVVGSRYGQLSRLSARQVHYAPEATLAADLDAASSQQGRFQVARDALAALLHHFGIAEPAHLAADGSVNAAVWGAHQRDIERWATALGVAITSP